MRQKFKIFLLFVFAILLISQVVFGDQYATTEDGKKVILKDNGLWEYATTQDTTENLSETLKTLKKFGIPYSVYNELSESGKRSYTILARARMDPSSYIGEVILLKSYYGESYNYTKISWIEKMQKKGYVYYIETYSGKRIQGLYVGELWIAPSSDWGSHFHIRFCCNYCPQNWIEGAKVSVIGRIVGKDKKSDEITIQPILVKGDSGWYSADTGEKVVLKNP